MKIHIAPCSCELHQALREALERNAELEAELALAQVEPTHRGFHNDCPDCIVNDDRYRNLKARAEKAEARVAELSLNRRDGLDDAPVIIRPCRDPECDRPLPHQAHTTYPEREAD